MAEGADVLPAIESDPSPEEMHQLDELLHQFNVTQTGINDGRLLAIFLRNTIGHVVGGIHGWIWGGTCYVATLYLPESLRHNGTGSGLMAAIEAEARRRGCDQVVLRTHDFQAPGFYHKLGFSTQAETGYPRGHRSLTLVKQL